MNTLRQFSGLIFFLVVCFAISGIAGLITSRSVNTWYQTLEKPAWNPPDWVFAPVWTVLYLTMAIAAWLVWRKAGFRGAPLAMALFFVQLALNFAWSWLFFGQKLPGWAFADIIVLWIAILATIIAFWKHDPLASGLLIPYLLWVTYASTLNYGIWRMNL